MPIRTTIATTLAGLALAAPAAHAGMTPEVAAAATTAFRATYGSDATMRFEADSAGATFVGGFRTEPLAADPTEAAWRFLEREAVVFGMTDPRATLRVERVQPWRAWRIVRFRQITRGRPVLGRGFVVVVDAEGRVHQAAGGFADVTRLAPGALLDETQAIAALQAVVRSAKVESLEPVVHADASGARLAWLAIVETGGPLDRFAVVQDAVSGMPLSAQRLFRSARADVYDENPVVDPDVTNVELLGLTSTTNLMGTYAQAYACTGSRCTTRTQRAVPDAAGDYLYAPLDPSFTDAFAEVMGYYHLDKANRFFNDTLGYTYSCGGHNWMMILVNFDYANAFYGDMDRDRCGDVTLGQGDVIDYAYDGDVIYHEFIHGIVDATANLSGWGADELGPDFSSGGLNEGTSDYFSTTISDDPRLGEYSAREGLSGELGIREAVNTFTCPQHLTGESHFDGRIWLGTTWEIRTAIGAAKTDALVFATLIALSEGADFDEAGRGLIAAAGRMVGTGEITAADQAEVERIVGERGLPGCVRIVDLYDPDTGERLSGQAFSMGIDEMGGWVDEMASGIQFRVRTPDTVTRMTLEIRPMTVTVPDSYDVYQRLDAPIHFTRSGWTLVIDGYDRIVTGAPTGLSVATWTDPPIVPGGAYYFTFVHRNPNAMLLGFTVSISTGPPRPDAGDDGDAGTETVEDVPAETTPDVVEDTTTPDTAPDAEPDAGGDLGGEVTVGGGCGCRTTGTTGPGLGLLLGLLALAALRKRRR